MDGIADSDYHYDYTGSCLGYVHLLVDFYIFGSIDMNEHASLLLPKSGSFCDPPRNLFSDLCVNYSYLSKP